MKDFVGGCYRVSSNLHDRSGESPDRGWARIVPRTGRLRKASMPGRPNIASNGLFFEIETGDDVM